MHDDRPAPSGAKGALVAVAVAVFAVVCCAGLPLLVAAAGSVALGSLLGAGAGIAAALTLLAVVLVGIKHRRACRTAPEPAATPPRPQQTADTATAARIRTER